MRKIFVFITSILEKISGKKIAYFFKQPKMLGQTAVKSSLGFWYAGDVLESHDIAYGILNNGYVEKDETDAAKKILEYLLRQKPSLAFYDIGANTGYFGSGEGTRRPEFYFWSGFGRNPNIRNLKSSSQGAIVFPNAAGDVG
jgi:hypothetical protein